MKEHLLVRWRRLIDDWTASPSMDLWRQLAEVTMLCVLVINVRRGMEFTELTMIEYNNRTNYVKTNILQSMSSSDRATVERYS